MKRKIITFGSALALALGLLVAPATVAPVESASAASCTTSYMKYFYPYYYRVTLKSGGRSYYSTYERAHNYLKYNHQAGSIHKLVGTMTSVGCIDHWQWKATVNYYVKV